MGRKASTITLSSEDRVYLETQTIFYKGIMPSETGFRFSSGL